jgi:glycosyltransferase involved in cell wall biosynthesis
MFYGRTVIATDCGGPSEIIDHGVTGLIVPIGNITKMQEAMDSVMGDPNKRETLAEQAYLGIRDKFSNSKVTNQLHKIYDAALMNKVPTFNTR